MTNYNKFQKMDIREMPTMSTRIQRKEREADIKMGIHRLHSGVVTVDRDRLRQRHDYMAEREEEVLDVPTVHQGLVGQNLTHNEVGSTFEPYQHTLGDMMIAEADKRLLRIPYLDKPAKMVQWDRISPTTGLKQELEALEVFYYNDPDIRERYIIASNHPQQLDKMQTKSVWLRIRGYSPKQISILLKRNIKSVRKDVEVLKGLPLLSAHKVLPEEVEYTRQMALKFEIDRFIRLNNEIAGMIWKHFKGLDKITGITKANKMMVRKKFVELTNEELGLLPRYDQERYLKIEEAYNTFQEHYEAEVKLHPVPKATRRHKAKKPFVMPDTVLDLMRKDAAQAINEGDFRMGMQIAHEARKYQEVKV